MNICVIGLGSMGKRRIKILQKLNRNVKITGIESNRERAGQAAQMYGIEVCDSLKEVNTDLEYAFVCTSPLSHGAVIRECLERNLHVFSEINLIDDQYEQNIELAGKKNKVLFLSSTPLYKAEMRIIDKRVKQCGVPCVYQYHAGQYLPDWHPWDSLNDFFISQKRTNGCREILAVELPWLCNSFGSIRHVNVIRRKLTGLSLDFPDTFLIQTEHENGNAGSLVIDVVSRHPARRLEVISENMYIKWDGTPDLLFEKNLVTGEMERIAAGGYIHEKGYGDFINEYAYFKEIEDFFEVINGKQPRYSFEKDKEILRIIDEIEKQGA